MQYLPVCPFFHTKRHDNIPTGTHKMGAWNAGGVGKTRDSWRIAGYRSMTGGVRTTTETVHRAVYRTDGDASVNLCVSQPAAWTTTTKRREENRDFNCIRSSKSEGEVTNKRRLCSTYCTIEANYRQTRSITRPLCDSEATRYRSWLQTRSITRPLCDSEATRYRSWLQTDRHEASRGLSATAWLLGICFVVELWLR